MTAAAFAPAAAYDDLPGQTPSEAQSGGAIPAAPPNLSAKSNLEAAELLSRGIAAYDAGRSSEARLQFERIVGLFPSAAEAQTARRYLSRLYAGLAGGGAPVQRVSDEQQPDAEASGSGASPSATEAPLVTGGTAPLQPPPAAAPNTPDEENLVPNERLNAILRSTVGDRVFFRQGSTDLGVHARSVLRGQAGWLKQQDVNVKALVAGHADDPLDDDGNKILSARRAEAVRARLIEEGVAPERVRVVAMGRSEPVANCPGQQCAAQNRRAVTVVVQRPREQNQGSSSQSYHVPPKDGPASW